MEDTKTVILLVEDDYALALGAEYALTAEGYEVWHASSVKEAFLYVEKQPDLILLDVMLPDGTGYDLCSAVRKNGNAVPIIFLTAVGEEVNVVQGLELGGDDYITKPYRVKELLSRISANLRRARMHAGVEKKEKKKEFGHHIFYLDEFRLMDEKGVIECTPSELRLLKELIVNQGNILPRNLLLERLYDTEDNFIDNNTLSVYMKRLRDKLGEDANYIETIRGIGYRFKK